MTLGELTPRALADIVLWLFLIAQGIAFLYLLHRIDRFLTPATAGPPLGLALPQRLYDEAFATRVTIGGDRDRPSILMFTSLYCEKCKASEPFLLAFCQANAARFHVAFIGSGPAEENRAYARRLGLSESGVPLVVLASPQERERDFGVRVAPYMLMLDRRGVIVAKGRVAFAADFREIAASSGLDPEIPARSVSPQTAYRG